MKFNVIACGSFDFLFDEEDRRVIVSYGSSSSDDLPALTEQAMCGQCSDGPSECDGIRIPRYTVDYGLSAMTVVSRRYLARCGQP